MIVADFLRTSSGFRMKIEGHADYAQSGNDIVCAATSSIFYALCGYLLNFKKGSFKVNAVKSGLADMECGSDCEDYLQLVCLGLWQLSCEYPDHIKVNIDAWRWKMNPDRVIHGH